MTCGAGLQACEQGGPEGPHYTRVERGPGPDSWARSLLPIHEARNSVMRAVIADDDRVMTAIVAKTLQAWEIEVSVAHDGRAAWEQIIARDSPALAIID